MMEGGSKSSAGNAANSGIVNQHQGTVNAESEMSTVAEQATKLKGLKISKNSDEKKELKIVENEDGNKTTAAMKKANKKKMHKSSMNKGGKEELSQAHIDVLTAIYLLDNPKGSTEDEIINFMLYQNMMFGRFQAFFDDCSVKGQKNEFKTMENKDDKKTTKAMKKANKKMARKSLKNKGGKQEPSQEYIDILTAVHRLDNPNGSSLDEVANFMISEYLKYGSFQAFFDVYRRKDSKISKNANQKKELRILENKASKKNAAAMKKADKTKLHKSSKNKYGKKELSKMELEILTPKNLKNPNGLSKAEILDFMIPQYVQHDRFPEFFDGVRLSVKDDVNRGISTKPDGK